MEKDTIKSYSSTATLTNNDQTKLSIENNKDSVSDDIYNPFDHRIIEHPNTFSGALIHVLKSSLGTGILAVPRAFKTAGLIVGTFGTLAVGFLCTYSIYLLVKASHTICRRTKTPSLGFEDTAETVLNHGPEWVRPLAKYSRPFIQIALLLTYFLTCAAYVVYISESVAKLTGVYYPETTEWTEWYKLMTLPLLILCCQFRELKYLVPFSFTANVTMIVTLGICLYYIFLDIKDVNVDDRVMGTSITNFPSFMSTVLFAMEGIGTIMPVENSLKKHVFLGCSGVLNIAMTVVVCLYTIVGFLGYFSFGDNTHAAITQNLPEKEIASQIAQGCVSVAVFFTFTLQFYVPMDLIWKKIVDRVPIKYHNIGQICMRTLTVSLIVGIAAAAGHHLDSLIDLVGALCLGTLGLGIPTFLDLILNWKDWGKFHWILVKDVVIMIFGIFGTISGTYLAIKSFFN